MGRDASGCRFHDDIRQKSFGRRPPAFGISSARQLRNPSDANEHSSAIIVR
jgi:hypothetical protein